MMSRDVMSYFVQEVEERFYLVFPQKLIILAVGASLSGYELKVCSDTGTEFNPFLPPLRATSISILYQ